MAFSFSFSGDDIEEETTPVAPPAPAGNAFPVQGKPLLPPARHDLDRMLADLPSKVAYGMLDVDLDDGSVQLPRRELWDVRLQLMAEDEGGDGRGDHQPGLGEHDVKTGIYEGGFKSWESSVDLVKALASEGFAHSIGQKPCRVIELGCGTALPSLALFLWSLANPSGRSPLTLTLADYNPPVLRLVTLPNLLLTWALQQQQDGVQLVADALSSPGELELTPEVVRAFKHYLSSNLISLSFFSGAWSPEFVDLVYSEGSPDLAPDLQTIVVGAETIYSPFALASFSDTVLLILQREQTARPDGRATAIVAAKKLYFGVGGSLDDFVDRMRGLDVTVNALREEAAGVRRGVVQCLLA